jgi:hypothetical protein
MRKTLHVIFSGIAGAGLVVAAFRFPFLNWVVDVPGWLVNRIFPIDFHEGEGAFGFFLSIFLSWLLASAAIWFGVLAIRRLLELQWGFGSDH